MRCDWTEMAPGIQGNTRPGLALWGLSQKARHRAPRLMVVIVLSGAAAVGAYHMIKKNISTTYRSSPGPTAPAFCIPLPPKKAASERASKARVE